MIQHHTCITIECNTCHTDLELDGVGGLHFANIVEAIEKFGDHGWDVRLDGYATCDTCVARQACAAQGCDWSPWRLCQCRGDFKRHRRLAMTPDAIAGGRCACEYRWCGRCLAYEVRAVKTQAEEDMT